ncbi:hypothetical protein ABZ816_00075 [Actinosynnema sp. NPDC047251]|uniref:hypothetical protein n=1 Tax=Saccharothrix espanaensis TaxID=103731 RepID=UPI0002DCF52D|nr:hypothetical protein [Saccharothrix espanaensis]
MAEAVAERECHVVPAKRSDLHPVFAMASAGLALLDLAAPRWWPAVLGWTALVAVLVAWFAYWRAAGGSA